MDDMGQLLSISMEGMKFTFEASKEAIEMMLKMIMGLKASAMLMGKTAAQGTKLAAKTPGKVLHALKYRKNAGKTNKDNFYLKSGGAAICQEIDKETFKLFEKYAKKTGVIYYEMADFSKEPAGKVHIMFPQDSLENLKSAQAMAEAEMAKKMRKAAKRKGKPEAEQRQEEKDMHEESIGKMAKDLGYADLSLDEMMQACMDRLETEEQRESFRNFANVFRGLSDNLDQENQKAGEPSMEQQQEEAMGERRGEKRAGKEASSLKMHVGEIKDAVKNNKLNSLANRADMVYMEVDEKHFSAEISDNESLAITMSGRDNEKGRDISVQLPKGSIVADWLDTDSHKLLVVLKKDETYRTKDGEKMSAMALKGIFNEKKDGKYSYSATFRKLFGRHGKDDPKQPGQRQEKASVQAKPLTPRKRG